MGNQLKNIFSLTKNSKTSQYLFSLKIKQLRKIYPELTPEELLELTIPKHSQKFFKK